MNKLLKKLKLNTITKKVIVLMLLISCLYQVIANFVFPKLFFYTLEDEIEVAFLDKLYSTDVGDNIGWILRQNSWRAEEFCKLIGGENNAALPHNGMTFEHTEALDRALTGQAADMLRDYGFITGFIVMNNGEVFCDQQFKELAQDAATDRAIQERNTFPPEYSPERIEELREEVSDSYIKRHLASLSQTFVEVNPLTGKREGMVFYSYPLSVDQVQGFVVLVDSSAKYKECLEKLAGLDLEDYLFADKNGGIVYASLPQEESRIDIAETAAAKPADYTNGWYSYEIKRNHRIFAIPVDGYPEYLLAVSVTNKDMTDIYSPIFSFVSLMLLVNSIILILIALFVQINSQRNLKKLSAEMKKVHEGDYDVMVKIDSGDEIEMLGNTFNSMIHSIHDNVEEINRSSAALIEHEKKEQEMKYALIFSQINPHFIYNTMNNITYLARAGKVEDIITLNKALMSFLRDKLRINDYEMYDSVRQEIDVCNDFMVIRQYSHDTPIELNWDVDEGLLDTLIPKNILHPFLSNAVYHGVIPAYVDKLITKGIINIDIKRFQDKMLIRIYDNGIGMSQQDIYKYFIAPPEEEIEKGLHIGIKNARLMLQNLYEDDFKFHVDSIEKQGLDITLLIPIREDVK